MKTETKTIKLSPKQKEVVRLMREGWELGKSNTFNGRCWLQKNGLGKGGETVKVNTNTLASLYHTYKLIDSQYGFPTFKYFLTELGKTIDID